MTDHRFEARLLAVSSGLVFGEVAGALGLGGSSRAGWDCPCCGAPLALAERTDHKGARCTNEACGEGFNLLRLVMKALDESGFGALAWLERLMAECAAPVATQFSLLDFNMEEEGRKHGGEK